MTTITELCAQVQPGGDLREELLTYWREKNPSLGVATIEQARSHFWITMADEPNLLYAVHQFGKDRLGKDYTTIAVPRPQNFPYSKKKSKDSIPTGIGEKCPGQVFFSVETYEFTSTKDFAHSMDGLRQRLASDLADRLEVYVEDPSLNVSEGVYEPPPPLPPTTPEHETWNFSCTGCATLASGTALFLTGLFYESNTMRGIGLGLTIYSIVEAKVRGRKHRKH